MKAKRLFSIIAMATACICLFAKGALAQNTNTNQNTQKSPYPVIADDDFYGVVKFKGQSPSIVDFVNNWLGEPEDELSGGLYDMWTRYWHKKPLEAGDKVIVDTKNAYVRFESKHEYDGGTSYSYTEFCYWNCADKKHKILGYNTIIFSDGEPAETEYYGWNFSLYENSTHRLAPIGAEELGAVIEYPSQPVSWGYSSDTKTHFVEFRDGTRRNMTKNEFEKWNKTRPIQVWELPRVGKSITVKIYNGKEVSQTFSLTFDGYKFKK